MGLSLAAVGLSGCEGGSDSSGQAPVVRNADISTLVQGYNPSTQETSPLQGAVFFSGASYEIFTESNSSGFARLTGFGAFDRLLLNIGASGYALQNIVVNIEEDESLSQVDATLLRMQNATLFSQTTGINKTLSDGSSISVAPNSLLRADGESIAEPNNFRLYLTSIDVNSEVLLPADLKMQKNKSMQSLEAYGAIHVQLDENKASISDSSIERKISRSNLLILEDNAQVDIAIPITAQNAPNTLSLYYFDPLTGFWEQQGILTKSADGTLYTGKTDKIGYLAALKPITRSTTLTGCVADTQGNPIPRARIHLQGTSYAGIDNQITDAKGKFSNTLKSGQQASLIAKLGQFKSQEVVVDAATQGAINAGNCITIDTTTSQAAVTGSANWQDARNFDMNIMLPNGDIMFYNQRVYNTPSGEAVRITENANGLREEVSYSRLMKGRHFIAINRFFDQGSGGITSSGGMLTIGGQTFEPPAGEVANRDSQLSDNRTHVWLAAVMDVDDECNISISAPSALSDTVTGVGGSSETKMYRDWIHNDDFVNGRLYEDGSRYSPSGSDSSYC